MNPINSNQETLAEAFARRLRKTRKDQYMTQKDLAAKAKISVAYASKLEQGQAIPSDSILEGIAAALNCDPLWLRNGIPKDITLDDILGGLDTSADGLHTVSTAQALQCRQLLQDGLQDINNLIALLREAEALGDLERVQAITKQLHIAAQISDVMLHVRFKDMQEAQTYYRNQVKDLRKMLENLSI